jgi:hypothetical protein
MDKPTTKQLREAVPGISSGYASMILSDSDDPRKSRTPARSLAIHIFRKTRWRHPSIADLTEAQMKVFEAVDPWTPRSQEEAA